MPRAIVIELAKSMIDFGSRCMNNFLPAFKYQTRVITAKMAKDWQKLVEGKALCTMMQLAKMLAIMMNLRMMAVSGEVR